MIENLITALEAAENCDEMKSIVNSFNKNQTACKNWMKEELAKLDLKPKTVFVAGGWFGNAAAVCKEIFDCRVTSVDLNPRTVFIGRLLYDNIRFEEGDCFEEYEKADLFVSTSVEHFDNDKLSELIKNSRGTVFCLQSNNYFEIDEHINCTETLEDFIDSLPLVDIMFAGELEREKYTRFMVIGK